MSLALETASKGITVNSVTPGYISTDMTAAVPPAAMDKIVTRIPVGRSATRTRWRGWWSSWPIRSRGTSPGGSTRQWRAVHVTAVGTTDPFGQNFES